ncbi:MAG: MMPL family transporter [Dehalococcoidia bacterium]|nr:MMPL family transporter [Dehalococcoidia bacterium]
MIAKILLGVWNFTQGKAKWILLIAGILLVVAIIGATQVKVTNDYTDYLDPNGQVYKDIDKLNENFSSSTILVIIEGDSTAQIVSDKNLAAMKYFDEHFTPMENVKFVITPEYMVQLAKMRAGGVDDGRPTEQWLIDPQTGQPNQVAAGVFFNPTAARMVLNLKGNLSDSQKHDFIEETKKVVAEGGFENVQTTVTGQLLVVDYMVTNIPKTVSKIMVGAAIAMVIILAVMFRSRGSFLWRWLTLSVIGLAVIYTMGIMGFIDLHITGVSMAVYPILLGLGMDYAIQFYNRYDEENRKGLTAAQSVKNSLEHIGPPLVIAMLVACAAFASVFFARTPMVQGFGKMLIMGVAACLVTCTMLLLPILYLRDRKNDATNKPDEIRDSSIDKMAAFVAHKSVKYIAVILVVAIGLSAYGWSQEHTLKGEVGYKHSIREGSAVMNALQKATDLSGGVIPGDVIVDAPNVLDPAILQWQLDTEKRFMADTGIQNPGHYSGSAQSISDLYMSIFGSLPKDAKTAQSMLGMIPERMWINFVNKDFTQSHIVLMSQSPETEVIKTFYQDVRAYFVNNPEGSKVTVSGDGLLLIELAKDLDDSRTRLTYIGLGFIFAMLLICFKFKIARVITAAVPIVIILGWSAVIMVTKDLGVDTMLALMPAQVMGIGVEFTVLLLMRYYEERDRGGVPMDCMITAMSRIGRAIVVSGLMVAVGFGALYFAKAFPGMSNFGFVTVIDMILVVVSTLIVLPGMVITFDNWNDKRKKVAEPAKQPISQ